VTEENPAITDAEQASTPPVIASVTEENPAITDAAQAWADAVRTLTTPLPVIPTEMTSATTPDGKNIDAKSKSESIDKTLEEILAEVNKNVSSADGITPQSPADESIKPSAPNAAPVPLAISPPATDNHKRTYRIATIVISILLVLGVVVIGSFYLLNYGEKTPSVVVPVVTVQPTPTPVPTLVPADGVWVRIEYPGNFIGEVGNPEIMHPAYGSGVRIYKILWSDRAVHAKAQKQENSGDTLTIEIYNNGTLIKRSSTRAPMGSVDILIDPTTGQPPGVTQRKIP